jgi:selenocysteine-specific elongation factor
MTQESPQGTMTVKDFRDRSGIGRNVAIDVLEFFDGKGFTRRQGNERIVVRPFTG